MSKRDRLALFCRIAGVTALLESFPKRRSLLVLNYHRVGDKRQTPYDPGTFSATGEEFSDQVTYLKRHFPIVSLPEALEIVAGKAGRGTAVLITFDDGYLDNYSVAFPVLRGLGVSATFFLPTAFVGTGRIPWWDRIAYQVRRCRKPSIDLRRYGASFEPARLGVEVAVREVLRICKHDGARMSEFLEEVSAATEVQPPDDTAERCFLDWDEAREMQAHGMCFGSHTHNHDILSTLSAAAQLEELRRSREIVEQHLEGPCDVLAYPVGKRDTFCDATLAALREAGYRAAFSFYGGLNLPGASDFYDLRRYGVDGQQMYRLRLQTAAVPVFGKGWV